MLRKIKNQENVIMLFFVIILFCVGIYAFFGRGIVDIVYFVVMLFYFLKFLRIRKCGR